VKVENRRSDLARIYGLNNFIVFIIVVVLLPFTNLSEKITYILIDTVKKTLQKKLNTYCICWKFSRNTYGTSPKKYSFVWNLVTPIYNSLRSTVTFQNKAWRRRRWSTWTCSTRAPQFLEVELFELIEFKV